MKASAIYKTIRERRKIKRNGLLGRYSEYWYIWNLHNPNDKILPDTGYIIHHKDKNPNNHEISNLQKMKDVEHKKLHGGPIAKGTKFSKEVREKLKESHKGQIPWNKGKTGIYSEEHIQKLKESHKGIMLTEETKQKISKALKGRKYAKRKKL